MEFELIEKVVWSGIAAGGFAVLFNTPRRLILSVFILASLAGLIKFLCIGYEINVIFASLYAASFVGFGSLIFSKRRRSGPFILSIPSIIPMIPGYYGYETLLGIIQLAAQNNGNGDIEIILSVTHNALNLFFVLAALSIGVSLPWFLFKEKGLRKLKITNQDDLI